MGSERGAPQRPSASRFLSWVMLLECAQVPCEEAGRGAEPLPLTGTSRERVGGGRGVAAPLPTNAPRRVRVEESAGHPRSRPKRGCSQVLGRAGAHTGGGAAS